MPNNPIVPVVRRPEYTIGLEQFDDYTLAHVNVRKWSAPVLRRFQADINTLWELHGGPIFALTTDDPKQTKFLRQFGFQFAGQCVDIHGTPRHFYRKDHPHG